uniref:Uncharacterized protein n=1 Tax=Parascaris equorum TaxID=6256 RepID=A0A914RPZ1_PAREQ
MNCSLTSLPSNRKKWPSLILKVTRDTHSRSSTKKLINSRTISRTVQIW